MNNLPPFTQSLQDYVLKQVIMVFGVIAFTFFGGCASSKNLPPQAPSGFKETSSGLRYLIYQQGQGALAVDGDGVEVHYTGKLPDGAVFDSSVDRGEPIRFILGKGQVIPGWEEAIKMMRVGDKGIFHIPPQLAYGESGVGPIPPNTTITFEMEVVNITKPVAPFAVEGVQRQILDSGVEYAIVKAGQGLRLEAGMNIKVHYHGFLEDGTMFDSSFERGFPIEFVLGRGMVITGWEQGLAQLNIGDRARIWIPYHLAYGERGRGPIPPKANLIFDVEVVDALKPEAPVPFETGGKPVHTTESGLTIIMVNQGTGPLPQAGTTLLVHYSGYLENGTLFDSSVQRGEPIRFVLGANQVIKGWDQGLAMLGKGAKARLIIPPHLAYGDREIGPIPPGSTLIFDVELIDFQ